MQTKRLKAWLYPVAIEREYQRLIGDYAKELQSATYKALNMRQDASDDDYKTILNEVMGIASSVGRYADIVIKKLYELAEKIAGFNRLQFFAVIKSGYGLDVFAPKEPWLEEALKEWSKINAELIKDIGVDYQRRIAGQVSAAISNGTDVDTLKKQIMQTINMPASRAELIAVDQTQKLNAQLTRERQTRIGITKYRWRGRLDARERPEHLLREGKIYSWDKPPHDGHAGVPIRCRCWAEMILPALEDIDAIIFGGGENPELNRELKRRGLI